MRDCKNCKNYVPKKEHKPLIHNGLEWSLIQGPLEWEELKDLENYGWRLPTLVELVSLFNYKIGFPIRGFNDMKDITFWTSESYANDTSYAWSIHFSNGAIYYNSKSLLYYVRYVREVETKTVKTIDLSEIKKDVTWKQAMDYAVELGEGWRLPTKEELTIIANSPRSKEFATGGWFWSSSTYVNNACNAWYVYFYNGNVSYDNKVNTYDARCVRGSFEDIIEWCFGKGEKC
jgi:hypothetical protein